MQRQDRESLCGVESKMFVQRQLSPRNMVVVVVMGVGCPCGSALIFPCCPRFCILLHTLEKVKISSKGTIFLTLLEEILESAGFPYSLSPNSQTPV